MIYLHIMNDKILIGALVIAVVIVGALVLKDITKRPPGATGATPDATQTATAPAPELTTSAKVSIEEITEGTGAEVKSGDTVVMHYRGTLEDGTQFDSSYDRGEPFTTQIGTGAVIQGWDQGVPGMKVGGKRKLIIPSELGYGPSGNGDIPPNATLIFEVELLEIQQK